MADAAGRRAAVRPSGPRWVRPRRLNRRPPTFRLTPVRPQALETAAHKAAAADAGPPPTRGIGPHRHSPRRGGRVHAASADQALPLAAQPRLVPRRRLGIHAPRHASAGLPVLPRAFPRSPALRRRALPLLPAARPWPRRRARCFHRGARPAHARWPPVGAAVGAVRRARARRRVPAAAGHRGARVASARARVPEARRHARPAARPAARRRAAVGDGSQRTRRRARPRPPRPPALRALSCDRVLRPRPRPP
ncbi:hypothetical protein B0H10DRAFT_2098184 [Mycena sp. CBHHK59/15]|nr:hypothetical protein B0H10DRAFT_2098184 [Mycena sp. CBHHK59/15]